MNQFSNGAFNFVDKSVVIGEGSTVWHFATVLADVVIGENVSIGSGAEIGHGTRIGNNSRIGSGVFLPPNSIIGSHVFIGPNCTFTDDREPRVNNPSYLAEPPRVKDHARIGAGCVILPGIEIGINALIGAGSVVATNVPDGGKVYGEKAKLREVSLKHLAREYGWVGGA
jgi:acetyltransferase-like isoleucine patch superfamily enzyme